MKTGDKTSYLPILADMSMNRKIAHTMPGGQSEGWAYDLDGNQVCETNFDAAVITNLYDSMNRLTNVASILGYKVSYAYSATGQRTNMVDPSGATAYAYDNRDRLMQKAEQWNGGPSISLNYLYDRNGDLTNLWSSTSGGVTNVYQYDPLNRLTNVIGQAGSLAQYGYDLAGNLQTMRYGNGVTNLFQYDALNRLTNSIWNSNSLALCSFSYQLGRTGIRTNLSETVYGTARNYQWQYDNLYRLTNENISSIGSLGYVLDPVGNRLARNSSGSQMPALLPSEAFAYTTNDWLTSDKYDNNGSTTNWNSGNNIYQYDVMNHVTNAWVNGVQILLTYDGDGNRVSKKVGTLTTYYLLDGQNPSGYSQVVEEWASTGTPALSKVYNYGLDLISQRQPNVSTNYFVFDGHGSTRMLLDNGGKVLNYFVYDAFGNLIASNGAPQTGYLYCGQQWDSDLGLYLNRARYLNPNTGRFWTMDGDYWNNEDPLSLHKYLYAQDDPVDGIDPSGNDDIGDVLGAMDISAGLDALNMAVTTHLGATTVSRLTPRTLYVRSFAPWKTFGGGFSGDDRTFTTAHAPGGAAHSVAGATSRITSIVKFQPMPLSILSEVAYSDPSHQPLLGTKTATPHVTATAVGNKMHLKMWGANPLVSIAPDIDVKMDMTVTSGTIQTHYNGEVYGDAFPDAEVFIVDPSEHATVLDDFATPYGPERGPFIELWGDNNRPMGSFSVWINN